MNINLTPRSALRLATRAPSSPGIPRREVTFFLLCILLFGWFVSPSPAQGTPPLNASYFSASDVPLTTAGFDGSGQTVEFTLNFAPAMGTRLTVVNNTGSDFIENEFDNLANGEAVELVFNGGSYRYVAWYFRQVSRMVSLVAMTGRSRRGDRMALVSWVTEHPRLANLRSC